MKLFIQLMVLAALWGASFLFLRISSHEFGVIPIIFVRTGCAFLALIPFVISTRQHKLLAQHWLLFLVLATFSTAVPFSLFAYTSFHLSAGSMSILNAVTPFFGALIAFFCLQEQLSKLGVLGLAIGFGGVYILSSGEQDFDGLADFLPVGAVLLAAFLYAASSTYVKLKLSSMTPLVVATGCQLGSAIVLFPFAFYYWPEQAPSVGAWSSALGLAVLSTAIALVLYLRLIQAYGVTKSISVTYLIPLFGVLWGYLFLDEVVSLSMMFGGALILVGIALSTGSFKMPKILMRKSSQ